MIGFVILYLGGVWVLANMGIIWTFIPGGTVGLVEARGNEKKNKGGIGGADVVDVIASVPGHHVQKSGDNLIEWSVVQGKEDYGLLHKLLKVHYIGLAHKVRMNLIHDLRFGKQTKPGSPDVFGVEAKDYETDFVWYSREQVVEILQAETLSIYALDIQLNILFRMTQPAKALLDVANVNAVLTQKVRAAVIRITSIHPAEYFAGGPEDRKYEICEAVMKICDQILKDIGITIYSVDVTSIDYDAVTKAKLQSEKDTQINNANLLAEATNRVLIAEQDLQSKMKKNKGEADHVQTVLVPLAKLPNAAALRFAEAYENNETVTTFGGGNLGLIVDPSSRGAPKPASPIEVVSK